MLIMSIHKARPKYVACGPGWTIKCYYFRQIRRTSTAGPGGRGGLEELFSVRLTRWLLGLLCGLIPYLVFALGTLSSFGFAGECLGQHAGDHQGANLGDGRGYRTCSSVDAGNHPSNLVVDNETAVIRWNYGDPQLGTCKETIQGGNHFRYWVQDGPSANRCVDHKSDVVQILTINSAALFLWLLRTRCP